MPSIVAFHKERCGRRRCGITSSGRTSRREITVPKATNNNSIMPARLRLRAAMETLFAIAVIAIAIGAGLALACPERLLAATTGGV